MMWVWEKVVQKLLQNGCTNIIYLNISSYLDNLQHKKIRNTLKPLASCFDDACFYILV